nr:cation:dicarboxylase symporter family transporter [Haloterrigena gelatinilytica]
MVATAIHRGWSRYRSVPIVYRIGAAFVLGSIAVLAGIGTAGVPSADLILMTLVLTQVGLPVEVVGFIAGIDPLLDRLRTMTNVTGDLAVATLVGHLNGEVDFSSGSWSGTTAASPSDD